MDNIKPLSELPTWATVQLILIAVVFTTTIAVTTKLNVHPDEIYHISTFDYYRNHWLPPAFGEETTLISVFGTPRIYNGEIVYLIYSKPARIIWHILNMQSQRYLIYRLFNVITLFILLTAFFFYKNNVFPFFIIGLTIVIFPQIQYVFAYVNTDAWSLAVGIVLFLVVLTLIEKPIESWKWQHMVILGSATGFVLAAKINFFLMLILPFFILGIYIFRVYRSKVFVPIMDVVQKMTIFIVVAFLLFGPLRVVFPLSIPNYREKLEANVERLAQEGYKPSNPYAQGFHLAEKGITYRDLLTDYKWLDLSAKSFFGVFGYFNVFLDDWIYNTALKLVLLLVLLTMITAVFCWKELNWVLKSGLILSPILIFINIYLSLYRSLTYDLQPQGRYLFPSLIPLAILLFGTINYDEKVIRILRFVVFGLLYLLSLYSLHFLAASPLLQ